MQITSDYKILNIIKDFQENLADKNIAMSLLLRLKQSLEFNATINWPQLYSELGSLYKDFRPYYNTDEYTPEVIDKFIGPNDILVIGTNTEGRHGKGAALVARNEFGAIYGKPSGLQGNAYGIITKDLKIGERSMSLENIEKQIDIFIQFALDNPDKKFWVVKFGCSLAGYAISEIAQLFANKIIPTNVVLPKEFVLPQYSQKYFYSAKVKKFFYIKNKNHIVVVSVGKTKEITEVKIHNIISQMPDDITFCDRDDFVLASEQVLKELY